MQIDVPIYLSYLLRAVSRICIINTNAVKNSHTSRKRIDSWNGQNIWMIMGTLRKSVIILDETKFNIYDLMGATVTGKELIGEANVS